MIEVLKHKDYTCWQSQLTGKCYYFDGRGHLRGIMPYFKNIPIPDALFAIEHKVFERGHVISD